jgi:hypothetical protein
MTSFENRIAEIDDQLFALICDVRLCHPTEDEARLASLREWHRAQLAALVADVNASATNHALEQIQHVFERRRP